MNKVIAIIVAAGQGRRAESARAKQWCDLNGRQVIEWSIEAFRTHPRIDEIIVVTGSDVPEDFTPTHCLCVSGGATRTLSVRNGLNAINAPQDDAIVLIHDAARPGLTHKVIDVLLDALNTHAAAAPALPVQDALKRQTDNTLETVSREACSASRPLRPSGLAPYRTHSKRRVMIWLTTWQRLRRKASK